MTTKELTREHANGVSASEQARDTSTFVPRFDIWETEEELVLNGDVPGVTQENLDIQFENEQLVIHGRVTPRDENRKALYTEYGIGDFHRTFTIGEAIDVTQISAELSGGVLTIHLPKSEQLKPRKIEVQAS